MTLSYFGLSDFIIDKSNMFTEWIVESPELFCSYLEELLSQKAGNDGNFVLSDDKGIVSFSKKAEIVINPFEVDINDKKFINSLYSHLQQTALSPEMYIRTQEILQEINEYLLELEQMSDSDFSVDAESDLTGLFKAFGIRRDSEDNLAGKISRYIKLASSVFDTKLVVFVNIRSYLNDEQISLLLKDAEYADLNILLLESAEKCCIEGVKRYIIDDDKCEIY